MPKRLLALLCALPACGDARLVGEPLGLPPVLSQLCEPGEVQPCYTGPSETEGVGECHAGLHRCAVHGQGFGACEQEVLPAAEICGNEADENCDGIQSCGETQWSKRLGTTGDEVAWGLAVDASRNVYLTGYYRKAIDFGGGPLPTVDNSRDVFLVKRSPEGAHLWSVGIQSDKHIVGRDLAVTTSGEVVVVASVQGSIEDFGLGALDGAGGNDVLIAAFDSDGVPKWMHQLGDDEHQYPFGVAVDDDGNIVVAGYFRGTMTVGESVLSSFDLDDVFVIKFKSDGEIVWAKSFPAIESQYARGVAIGENGNISVVGQFKRAVDFGGGVLQAEGENTDLFVLHLSPDGEHRFSRSFGDELDQSSYSVALDSAGNTVFSGRFAGQVNFGGGTLESGSAAAVFVVKLDPTGRHLFSHRLGGHAVQVAYGLAIDNRDRIVIGGYYEGTPSFGGDFLPAAGLREPNIFVAKLEADGSHLWSRGIRVLGDQNTGQAPRAWRRVAVDSEDGVLLSGYVEGPVNFGNGLLDGFGGTDVFVVSLAP